jgi:lipoyl(octanoyl) transferase
VLGVDHARAADADGGAPIAVLEPEFDRLAPDAPRPSSPPGPLVTSWLGRRAYREAWARQKELAARRAGGEIHDQLLLLEHEAVLTLGRGADEAHVRASASALAARGIEVIRVERGGEVTYHGPGQLVAYPIIAIARRGLLVRPLVRALEAAMIETCAAFGLTAGRRDGHPGCWVDPDGGSPRKVGALGIRIERGVTYHGIALNVDPDLRDFELIDPCGMPDVVSTSIAVELGRGDERPSTEAVRNAAWIFARAFAAGIDADLSEESGDGPAPVLPAR